MRKSKWSVAVLAALSLSVALSTAAHGAVFQSQALDMSVASGKQDKKKLGVVKSLTTDVITNYADEALPNFPDRYATNTKVYFPKDFAFNTSGLPQCENTPGFAAGTAANAIALCGPGAPGGNARVGTGTAALTGFVPGITAVINAFNGVPVGGRPTLLLHSESSAGPSLVLVGTLRNSDIGGFGKMLDVPVDLGPLQGTEAITDFKVTIPRVKLPFKKSQRKKFGKQRKKCKRLHSKSKRKRCLKHVNAKEKAAKQRSFVMAKCSKGKWNFRADSTYSAGAATTATDAVNCKQQKKKKKKS